MRFFRFINEKADVTEYIAKMKTECSEILDIYKKTTSKLGYVLFRILPHSIDFKKYHTTKNLFKNTSPYITNAYDSAFEEQFQFQALSWGISTTSDMSDATIKDGVRHYFFPKNGFQYIWSPKVDNIFEDIIDKTKDSFKEDNEEENKNQARQNIKLMNYRNDKLITAIKMKKEVLFNSPYYFVISEGQITLRELTSALI